MASQLRAAVAAFVSAVCERLRRDDEGESRSVLRRLETAHLGDVRAQPGTLKVTRHWATALEAAACGPTAKVAAVLEALGPFLAWVQNPNYTHGNANATFLANYGYAEILGKDGLFASDSLALGVLLLGPSTFYPEHSHPAAEIYYIVAGTGYWHVAGGSNIAASPGTRITIPSRAVHKMWTVNEPVIAIYLWDGEVGTRANFVAPGQ